MLRAWKERHAENLRSFTGEREGHAPRRFCSSPPSTVIPEPLRAPPSSHVLAYRTRDGRADREGTRIPAQVQRTTLSSGEGTIFSEQVGDITGLRLDLRLIKKEYTE